VRVWDPPRRKQVQALRVTRDLETWSVTWRPDGRWVAAGGGDGTIRVFRVRGG
jgi:WD40 repeat protein